MQNARTIITTVDELDALPVGAVMRASHGLIYERADDGAWYTPGDRHDSHSSGLDPELDIEDLPATVLWLPERQQ